MDNKHLVETVETRESIILKHRGCKLFGVFHKPITDRPVPAVMMCHGFAGTKVGRYRMYVRLSEALAKAGIASFRLDFRGCGDSEGNFLDTTLEGQIEDTLLGTKFLEDQEGIDKSRIGMLGRSLGGPVAVCAARRYGNIKSLALWAAVFHGAPWQAQFEQARKAREANPNLKGPLLFQGHPTNPELVIQLLSMNLEKEMDQLKDTPFLCIHSEKDEVVDMAHAELFRKLRGLVKAPSEFVRLLLSSHDFSDHGEQEETIKLTVNWYRRTLDVEG